MNIIGIVGGVGPYAGMDLFKKILDQTKAKKDQEHLPVLLHSMPNIIQDRTDYLIGKSKINPASNIAEIIGQLYTCGASVVGIPCNTAHADPIFKKIINRIPKEIKLLHLIEEVTSFIKTTYPTLKNIGVLSTTGTFNTNIYPLYLQKKGLYGIQVSQEIQENTIHPAIYNKTYGIKANTSIISNKAKQQINEGIDDLIHKGAEAIILGCTELPLALTELSTHHVPLIDPTQILARALILEASPTHLQEQPQ